MSASKRHWPTFTCLPDALSVVSMISEPSKCSCSSPDTFHIIWPLPAWKFTHRHLQFNLRSDNSATFFQLNQDITVLHTCGPTVDAGRWSVHSLIALPSRKEPQVLLLYQFVWAPNSVRIFSWKAIRSSAGNRTLAAHAVPYTRHWLRVYSNDVKCCHGFPCDVCTIPFVSL